MAAIAPVVLLNGAPADAEPAALRALAQSNYGHFTALRVRAGAAQRLDLHFERLRQGNAELFGIALDEAAVRGWMRQAAIGSGGDCSLRVVLFSRQFDHRHPAREVGVDVLVAAAPPPAPPAHPLRVRSCRFLRPLPHLKHVATFPLHHHRRQALLAGWDDAKEAFRRAVRLGLPTVVLIRRPADAVSSYLVRRPTLTPDDALLEYLDFYRTAWPARDGFVVAPFDLVVSDFGAVIDRVNKRFGTKLSDTLNGFRAIRREVGLAIRMVENRHTIEQEMVIKALRHRYRVKNVPAHEYARKHGTSHIRIWREWPMFLGCMVKNLYFS